MVVEKAGVRCLLLLLSIFIFLGAGATDEVT
jgi:hypothetical protein